MRPTIPNSPYSSPAANAANRGLNSMNAAYNHSAAGYGYNQQKTNALDHSYGNGLDDMMLRMATVFAIFGFFAGGSEGGIILAMIGAVVGFFIGAILIPVVCKLVVALVKLALFIVVGLIKAAAIMIPIILLLQLFPK